MSIRHDKICTLVHKDFNNDHDLSLDQLIMGKFLEKFFTWRQRNEMDIGTPPVMLKENSPSCTALNYLTNDFLLGPWGIEPTISSSFLLMLAYDLLSYSTLDWMVRISSDCNCIIVSSFDFCGIHIFQKLSICTMCCNPLRLISISSDTIFWLRIWIRSNSLFWFNKTKHSTKSQLKISYCDIIIKWYVQSRCTCSLCDT